MIALAVVQHQLLTSSDVVTHRRSAGQERLTLFGLQAGWLTCLAGLLIELPLRPQDAAPIPVLGNGHPAFDADAHSLTGFSFSRK